MITLSSGTPDFPTPPHVIEAAKRALDGNLTTYTPWAGVPELRHAIADKLKNDNGITADPDSEILVTTGTQEALQVICQALLDPGDEMITARTKAIIVISPSNPTGAVQTRRVLEQVAALAVERDLVVIADELYEKFLYDGARHHSIGASPGLFQRTITINGFSKCYSMTGFRIGYIAAPAEFVRAMLPIKHSMTICAPSVSQWAALAALRGPQEWFRDVLAEYDARRRMWIQALDAMKITYGCPQGAYYVYLNVVSTGLTGREFARRLREDYNVILGSGGNIGSEWEPYLRGSLAVPTSMLQEGLTRVAEAVERYCKART